MRLLFNTGFIVRNNKMISGNQFIVIHIIRSLNLINIGSKILTLFSIIGFRNAPKGITRLDFIRSTGLFAGSRCICRSSLGNCKYCGCKYHNNKTYHDNSFTNLFCSSSFADFKSFSVRQIVFHNVLPF